MARQAATASGEIGAVYDRDVPASNCASLAPPQIYDAITYIEQSTAAKALE